MPAFNNHNGIFGVPNVINSRPVVKNFMDGFVPIYEERNFSISGITKDGAGTPIGGCTVDLFTSVDDVKVATQISDGSGNYSFVMSRNTGITFYCVAYLAGSPDKAGTTVNTLTAA
jgi:hypothetical protein